MSWNEPAEPIDSGDPTGVVTNDLGDLPEVVRARGRGYEGHVLEAPMWGFIWIFWPRSHRAWLSDRRVRYGWSHTDRGADREPTTRERWTWPAAEYAEIEISANRRLRGMGLAPRPPGRIWLLRPPERFSNLDAVFAEVDRVCEERQIRPSWWPDLRRPVQEVVVELFEGDPEVAW